MADQATSIFSGSDQTQSQEANTGKTESTTTDSQLAVLVGEGRKYKSVEDLAKAYINLDSFTEKLKGENAEFREKLAGAKTIDDVIGRLEQSKASTTDKGEAKSSGLTADAVAQIVKDTVTGMETARSRRDNLLKADALMKKQFGDKAGEVFGALAKTPQHKVALQSLAEVDPEQFVRLFSGGGEPAHSQTDSSTSVNTAALADVNASGRVTDPGTKEYYNALRKKDPRAYYSQEVQLQMNKAATSNPTKFFGKG